MNLASPYSIFMTNEYKLSIILKHKLLISSIISDKSYFPSTAFAIKQ